MFRNIIAGLFSLSLLLAPLALAQDASHRAAAEELFEALNMEELLDQSIDQSLELEMRANPGLVPYRDTMKAFFNKHMSYESLRDPLMAVYTDTFTEQELRALVEFYQTPVGQKAAEKMPEMYQKGAEIGMGRVQDNIGELEQMLAARAAEIEAEEDAADAEPR